MNNKVDKLSASENMNNEEIINEVSVSHKDELTSNSKIKSDNNEIIKNVLESKVNNNSGDEVLVVTESSDERECDERLGLRRANFPSCLRGVKTCLLYTSRCV